MRPNSSSPIWTLAFTLAATATARAQDPVTMSIVRGGATVLANDCAGDPILPASLLAPDTLDGAPVPGAPLPPCIVIRHAGPGSLGLIGGNPNVEVDALSFGLDQRIKRKVRPGSVWFSVDNRARGIPFALSPAPTLPTESICGDQGASVFADTGLRIGGGSPLTSGPRRAMEVLDGNGLASCSGHTAPSLGLVEPHLPGAGLFGDGLDALDTGAVGSAVFFSLEGLLADPCGGIGAGSAQAHGVSPAAVLFSDLSGAPPVVWITPATLGLDLAGFGSDDLDALAIWDDGDLIHQLSPTPLGWNQGLGDMVIFSVRRGSTVIGQPDSRLGRPIEEGDVLVPPLPGGLSPFPAILIRGEALGLRTRRHGSAASCGPNAVADDLDALDVLEKPMFDCNGNGYEDALDILRGTSADVDADNVPDECG